MSNWSTDQIGSLDGKVVIVTGGNSGLGFESIKALAASGAQVVMASRTAAKAEAAKERIVAAHPAAKIDLLKLDLTSLDSVRTFAAEFCERYARLDVLMNNAGIMAIPRSETADGFETQFGTNHLGHFALTDALLAPLLATDGSRVVIVTSIAATYGRIRFRDLMWQEKYSRWAVYCQSKLANMLFGLELDRRFKAHGQPTLAVLAHPGFSSTNLQRGPAVDGGMFGSLSEKLIRLTCQSQQDGAQPQLFAATQAGLLGGEFIGPDGFRQMRGKPRLLALPSSGRSHETAKRLWQVSQELTGADYAALAR